MTVNNQNKGGMIVLLIFLLICSGLGIAAFVMSFTKKCGEGFLSTRPTVVMHHTSVEAEKTMPASKCSTNWDCSDGKYCDNLTCSDCNKPNYPKCKSYEDCCAGQHCDIGLIGKGKCENGDPDLASPP